MPPRIIEDGDEPPFIKDFTPAENRAMLSIKLVNDLSKMSGGKFLQLFQRLCCTPAGRADAQKALIGFLADPMHDGAALLKLLDDLVAKRPCPPPLAQYAR